MKGWGRRVYKVSFPIIWRQILNCLRKNWVGSLYRKARYITMSLQLITTNPKTNLCTIQLSNRLNVPGANFEQSIDCWIDLLKKTKISVAITCYFRPAGPWWWLLNISINHFVIWNILLNPLKFDLIFKIVILITIIISLSLLVGVKKIWQLLQSLANLPTNK